METTVESGKQKRRREQQAAEHNNGLLLFLGFLCVQPLAQELRTLFHQHHSDEQHGDKENPQQQPCLWVCYCASRDKEQQTQQQ